MKIVVEFDKCELHGECMMAAPEIFDIGDDAAVVELLDAEPGEQSRKQVEEAALMCPVAAIRIDD